VQYYDKARMEITQPGAVDDGVWYVTNGLLVVELVTGSMQVGDREFHDRAPAQVNVAGDADDPLGPTYATFSLLLDAPPAADGALLTQRVSRSGIVSDDPALAVHGVTAAHHVQAGHIDHQVAAPFWEFMTSEGPVFENGETRHGALFQNAFYATGYPISEAYWAAVEVAGLRQDVLVQCFERRCLTFTPRNALRWRVEAGNVGEHYYRWRYESWSGAPPVGGELLYASSLADWQPFSTAVGSGFVVDDTYHLRNTSAEGAYLWYRTDASLGVGEFGDADIAVDVRLVTGGPNAYGCVLARATPESEAPALTRAYSLCLDGFGALSVLFETWAADGSYAHVWLVEYVGSPDTRAPGEWNRLQIVARGQQFWFLVNGDLIGVAAHAGPISGSAGILVSNYEASAAEFAFQDLEIRATAQPRDGLPR
jgi:hypothetical protein